MAAKDRRIKQPLDSDTGVSFLWPPAPSQSRPTPDRKPMPRCRPAALAIAARRATRPRRFGALAVRIAAFFFVVCLTAPAHAERLTISVVIDAGFRSTGQRFVKDMHDALAPDVQKVVQFEPRVLPTPTVASLIRDKAKNWDMAVLSASALGTVAPRNNAIAFQMSYAFTGLPTVMALQNNVFGRAGLGALSAQGTTGMVYLNGGLTYLVTPQPINSPIQLKGIKIDVLSNGNTGAIKRSFSQYGATVSSMSRPDLIGSLKRKTAIAINPADLKNLPIPNNSNLLANASRTSTAIMVINNKRWNAIPFRYRARVDDAAVVASKAIDKLRLQQERKLLSQVSVTRFSDTDREEAVRSWIEKQPEAFRSIYRSAYDAVLRTEKNNGGDLSGLKWPSATTPAANSRAAAAGAGVPPKIYFATTREQNSTEANLDYRFGDARTDIVKCGTIKKNPQGKPHLVGQVIASSTACGTWLNGILESVDRALIFVHGFNNRFSDAVARGLLLKRQLGSKVAVILWSWPAKREALGANYLYDKESAVGLAALNLHRLFKAIKPGSKHARLDILAHSMGAWDLLDVLPPLFDDAGRPTVHQVIFAAPDVPRDQLQGELSYLHAMGIHTTLYACGDDWALRLSHALNAFPRAGTGGSSIIVNRQADSINVDGKWFSTNHSYVFEVPQVLHDVDTLVATDEGPAARGLEEKPKTPWHYWIFP